MEYEVVGLLGRGAMAVVELAVTPDGTRVARKRLPLDGSAQAIDMARRRLRREAEILGALQHPAIVAVLEVEDDGTDVVIVMPALEGSLADRVAVAGPLRPAELVRAGRLLLEGLAAAHRSGVVHRDIKPGNVLFDRDGRPALADFGVAVSRDLTAGLTLAGTVVGTASWMAPEQARGEGAGPASDVFSLGATLLFAATGEGPWGTGPAELVMARAASGAVGALPASTPSVLRAPLAAMLDPDPARRPSAAAILGGWEGTEVALPAPPGGRSRRRRIAVPAPPGGRSRRRRVVLAAAGAAAGLVLLAATLLVIASGGPGTVARSSAHRRSATPAPCHPLRYQACGAPALPHTDGVRCLPGWYDMDAQVADGCEARSDYSAGEQLLSDRVAQANLVPAGAVDTFVTRVDGDVFSLCSGTLHVQLTAPAGTADLLQVWHGSSLVASATSVDGQVATAAVQKPGCFGAHSETLSLRVSGVVGASADDFLLRRSGGW